MCFVYLDVQEKDRTGQERISETVGSIQGKPCITGKSHDIVNALPPGKFCMFFFVVCRFFSKSTFSKNSFRNTIGVSNYLQKLAADDTWR